MTRFTPLPHRAPYPTKELSAALERRRQEVLDSAWRPLKCNVPWTPAEESDYRAQNPQLEVDPTKPTIERFADSKVVPIR